jgi:hypothetical protein
VSKPIVVGRFSFPHEAHIARGLLESAGLKAFVTDEHTINANWLYSQALGEVKLSVPASQVADAVSLLSQDFSGSLESEFGVETYTCPKCGSQDSENFTKGKLPAFVVFILIGFPLFFYKHGRKCRACGEFWET